MFYGKSETPVCPHLLRNPRRNQGRPQIKEGGLYAAGQLWTIRFASRPPKGYLKVQLQQDEPTSWRSQSLVAAKLKRWLQLADR